MNKYLVAVIVLLTVVVGYQDRALYRLSNFVEVQNQTISDYWDLINKCNKEKK